MELTSVSSFAGRPPPVRRLSRQRSAITNNRDLLPGIDGRSAAARRFRDITAQLLTDQGGDVSEARLQLIRRFSAACVLAEQMEARIANGEQIDIAEHAQLCSTLVRVGQRIGIDRIAKDVSPNLSEYLQANYDSNGEAAE